MPVKINASTSSGLVVDSDLTGSLQLQTGGNPAISIDSSQVTNFAKQFQIGGVLPPAFSATKTTTQNVSTSTQTKIVLNSEEFDTANCFDSATNSRFTPNVAGYYQLNAQVRLDLGTVSGTGEYYISIFKNGSIFKRGFNPGAGYTIATGGQLLFGISTLVYANGSTDYFELYAFQASSTTATVSFADNPQQPYFQGFLVRAA